MSILPGTAGNNTTQNLRPGWLCPVCGSHEERSLIRNFYTFQAKSFDFVQCRGCGLIHVNPIPDDATIQAMYGDTYFCEDWIVGRYDGGYAEIMESRLRGELKRVVKKMEKYIGTSGGNFFEIGAAGGGFLNFVRSRGWKVEGIEISSWGVRHARERYGIELQQENAAHAVLKKGRYQAVFMGDVFEHVPNPSEVLRNIHGALQPNGHFIMLLPMYVSSWWFRFFLSLLPFLKRIGIPKKMLVLLKLEAKEDELNPPYHIFEYSGRTISGLLERNGFRTVHISGSLPVPEFLERGEKGESGAQKILRLALLACYQIIRFTSEHFKFPLVRGLVIAQKK